jgi:hypothetical protein
MPLIAMILLLLERVLDNDKNIKNRVLKKTIYCLGIVVSSFLIILMFCRFILDVYLPEPYATIGVVIFLIYYFIVITTLGGIAFAGGHTGISPTRTINSIYLLLKDRYNK